MDIGNPLQAPPPLPQPKPEMPIYLLERKLELVCPKRRYMNFVPPTFQSQAITAQPASQPALTAWDS